MRAGCKFEGISDALPLNEIYTGEEMFKTELHILAKRKMKKRIWDWYREPGYRYYHCLRTAMLVQEIIENTHELEHLKDDISIIMSAALVHDIKKMRKNHAERAGKYLKKYLQKEKIFDIDQRTKIIEMVSNHDKKNSNEFDDYTYVLQDADILSRHGTVQVFSVFYKSGMKKRTRVKTLEDFDKNHINNVEKDMNRMRYEYSKRKLREESEFVNDFFNRMRKDLYTYRLQ